MEDKLDELTAVSPIDGRYASKSAPLRKYFSEYALISYRVKVELMYLIELHKLEPLKPLTQEEQDKLLSISSKFSYKDAKKIKHLEAVTNHDVKAVEYFLKEEVHKLLPKLNIELIHFGLTSQDVNNVATPLLMKHGTRRVLLPQLREVQEKLEKFEKQAGAVVMLGHTHGQAATPVLLKKELAVFRERLLALVKQVDHFRFPAKFGGATGGLNAHYLAWQGVDWNNWANGFITSLGLNRNSPTTQIDWYDQYAELFYLLSRICTMLIDLCRDMWSYIMLDYFKQGTVAGEVGSSAMPHKVNPIDFENAEGNLGIAVALFEHLAHKLPISRLQRDLTDSTVLRNIGVPYGHLLISLHSIQRGIGKLSINKDRIESHLESHPEVLAEAIQACCRLHGVPQPYEQLRDATRGKSGVTLKRLHKIVEELDLPEDVKELLLNTTPKDYGSAGAN